MKWIILTLLVITSSAALAQQNSPKVTKEDPTAEQIKRGKIFHNQIRPKEKAYAKLSRFLNEPEYLPGHFPQKNNKAALTKYIIHIQKILGHISYERLKGYCTEINQLRKSINEYRSDACSGIELRIKSLNNKIVRARALQKENKIEDKQKVIQKDVLANLESDTEMARQAANQAEDVLLDILGDNKEKSLDDFLADRNRSNKSSNYDPLADIDIASTGSSDPLAGLQVKDDNQLKKYKIDYKNGQHGVLSSSGKILIPYKNWDVVNYQDGIAKVNIDVGQRHQCSLDSELNFGSQGSWGAMQSGFVDLEGEFLDGTTLSFSFSTRNRLYLTSSRSASDFDTREEYQAYERRVARGKSREKVAYQKCKQEAARWKQSIARTYK
jgi:hypothetical protein